MEKLSVVDQVEANSRQASRFLHEVLVPLYKSIQTGDAGLEGVPYVDLIEPMFQAYYHRQSKKNERYLLEIAIID